MNLSLKIILKPWKLLVKVESGKRKQSVNISTIVTARPLHVLPLCFCFSQQDLSIYPHSTLYKTHRYFHITRHLPWVCSTEPPHPSYFLVGLLYYIVSTFLEPFEYVLQHRLPRFNNSGATSQLTAMKCVVWWSATQMPTGGMFAACTTVLVSCHSVYTLDMLTLFQCRTD